MYKISSPPPLRWLKLSRFFIDATRFTAAAPHAYSNPSSPILSSSEPSQPSQRSTGPSYPSRVPRQSNLRFPKSDFSPPPSPSASTETPVQKVARLRAERAAKRAAEITLWDRIVIRGRVVADSAHRVTVLFLMVFSVLCCGLTLFALADMIVYNRRKKREYFANLAQERQKALTAAIANEVAGLPLSEEQAIIMNQERKRFNDEEERARRRREWWQYLNVKRWLVSGLKRDDEQTDQEVFEDTVEPTGTETTATHSQEPSESDSTGHEGVLAAVEDTRRAEEKQLEAEGVEGSTLDRMAARAAELGKGWGWGSGK